MNDLSFLKVSLMGRKRGSTEDDRIEELEAQVRELKSYNRHLIKRLKQLDRGFKFNEPYEVEEPNKNMCPDCGKGEISAVEIGPRRLISCSICDFRRTEKL